MTDARYLRIYIRQLRQKVETGPERPRFVRRRPVPVRRRASLERSGFDPLSPGVVLDALVANERWVLTELMPRLCQDL